MSEGVYSDTIAHSWIFSNADTEWALLKQLN